MPEPEGVGNRMRAALLCPDLGNQAAAVAPGETGWRQQGAGGGVMNSGGRRASSEVPQGGRLWATAGRPRWRQVGEASSRRSRGPGMWRLALLPTPGQGEGVKAHVFVSE